MTLYMVVKRMHDGKIAYGKPVFGWAALEAAREKRLALQNKHPGEQFAILDEDGERIED